MLNQTDVPFTALSALGEHSLVALHSILLRDMLTNYPYRTNKELGVLLGLGEKRVVQLLATLQRWGLVRINTVGRKRTLAISVVPNALCLAELHGFLTGTVCDPLQYEKAFTSEEVSTFTSKILPAISHLIHIRSGLVVPTWPSAPGPVSTGYVTSWDSGTELAFAVSNTNSSCYKYYNSNKIYSVETIDHAVIGSTLGLASLAKIPKKAVAKKEPTDLGSSRSKRFQWIRATDLPLDTENYGLVVGVLDYWNERTGQQVQLKGAIYGEIRQYLVELEYEPGQLEAAIDAFASDANRKKRGMVISELFRWPSTFDEYVQKSTKHDRFARNLKRDAGEGGEEAYAF